MRKEIHESLPGEPDLTDADFTTVEVFEACDDCDFSADGCEEITLTSTLSNYEVLRSDDGPNSGFSSLGVAGGNVFCWGSNTNNQLLVNGGDPIVTPVQINLPRPATQVETGELHTCALLEDEW